MRIESIEAIALGIPMLPMDPPAMWTEALAKQIIVKIRTDTGLIGLGEAFAYGAPLAVCNVVDELLAPLLIGRDPLQIAPLTDAMQRATAYLGRRGIAMFAVSGIEIALWDLLGKASDAPLYDLLGGARRMAVPAYASMHRYDTPERVATACAKLVAQGFRILKLHQDDVASVKAAREAVGEGIELYLDVAPARWNAEEAIAVATAMAPYRLGWFEEAVWPPEDYEALASVRHAIATPIAIGEQEATVFGFRQIIQTGAADVLQPSVTKVGGIAEFREIAAMAEAAGVDLVPHAFYSGPGLAATLHLLAAARAEAPIEFFTGALETPLLKDPIEAIDGLVQAPDGPGLGVDLNPAALLRRYQSRPDAGFT